MYKNTLNTLLLCASMLLTTTPYAQEIAPVAPAVIVDEHAGHDMHQGKRIPKFREKMNRLDTDGNKRLDRSEVEGHQHLEKNFERMDRNNNGYVGRGDFRKFRRNKNN